MLEPSDVIQADFDRIAIVSNDGWNHNDHYHPYLLHSIPFCENVLDVGCGTGTFSRQLAQRAKQVLALDLSPEMIRIARARSAQYTNIDYQVGDIMTWELPNTYYDCIVSIATLHHISLAVILPKLAKALRMGGRLLVLDLFKAVSIPEFLLSGIAVPADVILRLLHNGRLRTSKEIRSTWAEHSEHEHYVTLKEIKEECEKTLPGAKIRQHLLWRYSLVWQKPGGPTTG